MADPDERYVLVLDQVTRALSQQMAAIDNLRSRAGIAVSAAALVSSFLGASTLEAKSVSATVLVLTILAVISLAVVVAMTVAILWPYAWRTGFDAHAALSNYVEADDPADINVVRREFAYHMQTDVDANKVNLTGCTDSFRLLSWQSPWK